MNNSPFRSHQFARMSWMIPGFLFLLSPALGILAAALKIIDQQQEKKEQESRDRWMNSLNGSNSYSYSSYPQSQYNAQRNAGRSMPSYSSHRVSTVRTGNAAGNDKDRHSSTTAAVPKTQRELDQQNALRNHKIATVALFLLGVFALISGVGSIFNVIEMIGYDMFDSYVVTEYLIPGILKLAASGGMFFCGKKMQDTLKQENLIQSLAGKRSYIMMDEVCEITGLDTKKAIDLCSRAISHGIFGTDAYLDMSTRCIVIKGKAPEEKAVKKEKPQTAAQPAGKENEYETILRELHEINESIPGEEMTAKINKLEAITARIFEIAAANPSKRPQLKRFMDYYLPTAQKLLKTYANLERQGISGSNISESKAQIERSMDMLIKGFEAQLDKLFQDDALDVSGEVAALQGVLSMDGLVDPDFDLSAQQDGEQTDEEEQR